MFIPKRILFQKNTLNYEIGKNIYKFFKDNKNVEIIELSNNRIKDKIPGEGIYDFYREGKKPLWLVFVEGLNFNPVNHQHTINYLCFQVALDNANIAT